MQANASGTLGNVQLMAWANAASLDAVRLAAKELGFTQVVIEAGTVAQATAYLRQHASPEILLVEIGNAEEAPAQLDALADVVNPLTKVLATGVIDSIRFYQWLSDLGIDGYLLQPFAAPELKQAIAKGAIKKAENKADGAPQSRKTIAVIGARGGVGTTTIASNLGALFAREHRRSTAIIDLDPYFGSVALSLDLEPSRGLRDALEKPDRVDALFLERVMIKPFEGLSILSAEEPLSDPITVQPNAGEMIFAALTEKFTTVLVDLPRQMNPMTRYVLAHADHTIIVAEPQLTSLRDSLRIRDLLVDQLRRPAPLLVLNRVGMSPKHELTPKEFAKNYAGEIAVQVPFMADAIAATAQGELLIDNPKLAAPLAPLRTLLRTLIGQASDEAADEKPAATTGSLMSRLSGKK